MIKLKNSSLNRIIIGICFIMLFSQVGYASELLAKSDMEEIISRSQIEKNDYTGMIKDKNIVVLQIDSLQNFLIDFQHLGQEITPNLNDLKKESSLYFNNYYELMGKGETGDAEFVSNNSLYPNRDLISYEEYAWNSYYGLAHYLKDNGYKTNLLTSNRRSRFSRDLAYTNQGFTSFMGKENFEIDSKGQMSDRQLYKQLLESMKNNAASKSYYYVSNSDSQKPYLYGREDKRLKIEEEYKDTAIEDYLQTMHHVDLEIGRFIEDLKIAGLYDNTVIIVQGGSHGVSAELDALRNKMKKLLSLEYNHKNMLNIPLIVHIPNMVEGETINALGSHLDFYPTMVNLLDYGNKNIFVFGKDLLSLKEYRPISVDNYRPKSLLDQNSLFLMANDGVYEKSVAIDIRDNRKVDIDMFKPIYEKLDKEIRNSKYIVENDLIKDILKDGIKAVEDSEHKEELINIGGIDKKDFETVYKEGHRYFRMDINDWASLKDILKDYSGISYLIRVDVNSFSKLVDLPEEIGERTEIEITSPSLIDPIKDLGYEKLVFNAIKNGHQFTEGNFTSLIVDKAFLNSPVFDQVKNKYNIIVKNTEAPITRLLDGKKIDTVLYSYRDIVNTLVTREVKNKHIIAHAGGKLGERTYTNSLDAVENSYQNGVRLMEIDFEWTTDDKLISTHSWDGFIGLFFNVPVQQYSYDEFVNFTMINGWTQLYPDLLETWYNEYPEVYMVTDVKSRNIEALTRIIANNPYLVDKIIPQVYNLDEYYQAESLGFKNIILTLYMTNETDDKIVEFAQLKRPYAITMSKLRAKSGLPQRLKDIGIFTYAHTINDREMVNEMEDLGIMGIYTDSIRP